MNKGNAKGNANGEKSVTLKRLLKERLKALRLSLDKSQKEMDSLLDIGKSSWQRYETVGQIPGSQVIAALADQGFNAHWILTGKGEMRFKEGAENEEIKRLTRENDDLRGQLLEKKIDPERDFLVSAFRLSHGGSKDWDTMTTTPMYTSAPVDIKQNDGFAVEAVEGKIVPANIQAGFLLYCDPTVPIQHGDVVFVELEGHRAGIRIYLGDEDGRLLLQGRRLSTDNKHEAFTVKIDKADLKRIAPVIYIKRRL